MLKYKYVTVSRLKTKTVQTQDDPKLDSYVKLQPRLIIHLTKTPDFNKIYDDFEAVFQKVVEDHQEDANETIANAPPAEVVADENQKD